MRVVAAVVLSTAALAGVGASCGDNDGQTTTPTAPPPIERPAPDFRLLVITDLKGYLAPCGCNERPLGGIDRMAAKIGGLTGDGPALVVAAGDLFFGNEEHGFEGDGAETQEIWKAELLVEIMEQMGVRAVTPGPLDLSMGLPTFTALEGAADFDFLAAGIEAASPEAAGGEGGAEGEEGEPAPSPTLGATLVVEVAGTKVGLVGVPRMESLSGALPEGLSRAAEPIDAARAGVTTLQNEGAEIIVALVTGTRRDARQVAGLDGVDFVVQAGLDQAEAIAPIDVDGTFLVHGGRQGQGLLAIDVWKRNGGAYTDWSDWTTDVERERLEGRVEELRARIAEWEADDSANEADVREQRGRLERMERELAAIHPPTEVEGNAFAASWQELPPDAERDASIRQRLDAHDRRVNENNARVFADLTPRPAAEGEPHYVGSASCAGGDCHQSAVDWWTRHAHGRAYATLVDRHKEFNLSCVGCHVTGYMQPGGSTVTHNLEGALVNVGCESCHGPGSAHVEDPEADGLVDLEAPEQVCVRCHNPEHSDRFVYSAFINMILVPGHGRPARE